VYRGCGWRTSSRIFKRTKLTAAYTEFFFVPEFQTMSRIIPERDALVFQCKDILARDAFVASAPADEDSDSAPSSDGERRVPRSKLGGRKYQILLFGTTATGASVTLMVDNFEPFFYVRIPEAVIRSAAAERFLRIWLMNGIPLDAAAAVKITRETHKTLMDYNGGALAHFLKITVPSQALWRAMKDKLLNKASEPIVYETKSLFGAAAVPVFRTSRRDGGDTAHVSDDGGRVALKVYESNIDPMLRFFHIQGVSPAGWVSVDAGDWEHASARDAKTDIVAACEYTAVKAGPEDMAPFLIASWDIECNSSHGDFPLATKTWRKPVREMYENGAPASLDAMCDALAAAINGRTGILSSVYLKRPLSGAIDGAGVKALLDGHGATVDATSALAALRAAKSSAARETAIQDLDKVITAALPALAGDEIIQIGTVLYRRGAPVSKHIWVLGGVDEASVRPPGAVVPISAYSFTDESKMIQNWFAWLARSKVDILIGYNIFGFDSKYIHDRLVELVGIAGTKGIMEPLSCLRSRPPRLDEKFLSSSAMGDNTMWILSSPGRLQIDLLPYVRRNHNLDSYTLDNVSATFVSGAVNGGLLPVADDPTLFRFATKSTKGTVVGRYITIMDAENDRVVERCAVVGVEPKALTVRIEGGAAQLAENGGVPARWAQVKDDVSPKDIFRLHRGDDSDRATVARYCLQDCDLVMELFNKLEVLNNSVAMANVCSVPVGFIFTRGQGIKIESLIFKECRAADQLIEVLRSAPRETEVAPCEDDSSEADEVEDSYEGAIVLEPHTGIYLDDPVTADDFASLYPSSIISENISHDTLIWVKDYDNDGNYVATREGSDLYDNIAGAKYVNIEFDILRTDPADTRKHPAKIRDGRRVARYIQDPVGTIPRILSMLLANRKRVRKLAEAESDEFRRGLLDAQQLAYKLTANSLYGQLGSATFKIRRQVLAASTTGYGRKQLMFAKAVIEEVYGGGRDPRCDVECVYGDTDSIFLRFRPRDPVTGLRLTGADALRVAKELTIESGKLVSSCLKAPHDFEFDKIFRSFILLSKKRYVGDMSEDGLEPGDFHRKSMGIVMKRRDNAPIVKYVYGNAVDRILNAPDVATGVRNAATFVQTAARELLAGKFPISKLTITKSLRANYADPTRIAHKVLADRIGERDPGNKPSTSDRIPFVYITHGGGPPPKLQGDRIETPSYIAAHGLKPDYAFYITNQIAKPVSQVFGLAVEHMQGARAPSVVACAGARDPTAARESLAESLLFERALTDAARAPEAMAARGQRSIASMFAAASREAR
jgi:DNA polymerase elongation subunit (family B)